MTHSELVRRPIGTTDISVAYNDYWLVPWMRYVARHSEKIHRAVRIKSFYGETEQAALEKARAYDAQRQEKFKQWRSSRSAKRRKGTSII